MYIVFSYLLWHMIFNLKKENGIDYPAFEWRRQTEYFVGPKYRFSCKIFIRKTIKYANSVVFVVHLLHAMCIRKYVRHRCPQMDAHVKYNGAFQHFYLPADDDDSGTSLKKTFLFYYYYYFVCLVRTPVDLQLQMLRHSQSAQKKVLAILREKIILAEIVLQSFLGSSLSQDSFSVTLPFYTHRESDTSIHFLSIK